MILSNWIKSLTPEQEKWAGRQILNTEPGVVVRQMIQVLRDNNKEDK